MTDSQPKVSVIIPVYNTAPYLRRCLDSVCGQTLRDIEIICVNDGSTDGSPEILREYAAQDARVRVIDFAGNKGVSIARNTGMDAARGEYIGFVDSDDYIDPYFFDKLYANASKMGAYIVKGKIQWRVEDGEIQMPSIHSEVLRDKMNFSSEFSTSIYRTSFIRDNGIIFPLNITNGEDLAFLAKAVCLAPAVETVDDVIYHYCKRSDSADTKMYTLEQLHSVFKAQEDVILFLNARDICEADVVKIYARYIERSCVLWHLVEPESKERALVDGVTHAVRLYKMFPNKKALSDQLITLNFASRLGLLEAGNVTSFVGSIKQFFTPQKRIFSNLRSRVQCARLKK
jgi:glycosyltransferase involved in cell wall biosynthesis